MSKINIDLLLKKHDKMDSTEGIFDDLMTKIDTAIEVPQELNICELEFILSSLLRDGYNLIFICT